VGESVIDEHGLALADAIRPIRGLLHDGGVPPRIVMDQGIGGGEVHPRATGLEADQEQRNLARLEALDTLLAFL
jgi:hypothetical protein